METKQEILQKYFGYSSFRQGQETLIDGILAGRDVFGVMPTGGGKSLCYQIPALMLEGITLVVSPLISLMKDQVMALKENGAAAAYINSSLTSEQIRLVFRRFREGRYKIVYIAPERLLTEGFLSAVRDVKISLLAVDEAHCISQWGQDFRPSYLKIADFVKELPERPPIAAFTATATEQVRRDVEQLLELRRPLRLVTGFDRPNLYFGVKSPRDKDSELLRLLRERKDRSGIIYCATRRDVEEVCEMLCDRGFAATRYHAGLSEAERRQNQEDFTFDRKTVMAATNAFGMGIDKSNVSFVIHYNMPASLEAYYQEAGRAGRDGSAADCILFWSAKDIRTAQFFAENSAENDDLPEEERERIKRMNLYRLNMMVSYCKTTRCLRGYILDYFGQEHAERCENCSCCRAELIERDSTAEARRMLSGVREIRARLGYGVGQALVVRTLRGSGDKRVAELGLDTLSCYGALRSLSREDARALAESLVEQGYLKLRQPYATLELAEKAEELFSGGGTVITRTKKELAPVRSLSSAQNPAHGRASGAHNPRRKGNADPDGLFEALKACRLTLAREEDVPAFVVFSNATLEDMAQKAPTTIAAFMDVNGVGHTKAQKYGKAFLETIREYLERQ